MLPSTLGDKMKKIHLKMLDVDARDSAQSEFEYTHQTACGYVRDNVTRDVGKVTCFFCQRTDDFKLRRQTQSNA